MHYPENRDAFIRSLGLSGGAKVKSAAVLGFNGKCTFHQYEDGLLVQLPREEGLRADSLHQG